LLVDGAKVTVAASLHGSLRLSCPGKVDEEYRYERSQSLQTKERQPVASLAHVNSTWLRDVCVPLPFVCVSCRLGVVNRDKQIANNDKNYKREGGEEMGFKHEYERETDSGASEIDEPLIINEGELIDPHRHPHPN
jgi:hypothetical protein